MLYILSLSQHIKVRNHWFIHSWIHSYIASYILVLVATCTGRHKIQEPWHPPSWRTWNERKNIYIYSLSHQLQSLKPRKVKIHWQFLTELGIFLWSGISPWDWVVLVQLGVITMPHQCTSTLSWADNQMQEGILLYRKKWKQEKMIMGFLYNITSE